MIRSLILSLLTLTLGMFFILIGQFKVTSRYFPDIHDDMKREFGRINKVFPFSGVTGWRPYAKNYRMFVGLTEMTCGIILIILPGRLKQLANWILLMMMLGAVYTHYTLHDKFDRMIPGIVFSFLLVIRLIMHRQEQYSKENIVKESKMINEDINQKITNDKKCD